ncbi:Hypothetical protein MVR_LOCUS117 [uncultured virus]|nr:Hypothetical protein MVR_LOCUS117 [uncultured virus]
MSTTVSLTPTNTQDPVQFLPNATYTLYYEFIIDGLDTEAFEQVEVTYTSSPSNAGITPASFTTNASYAIQSHTAAQTIGYIFFTMTTNANTGDWSANPSGYDFGVRFVITTTPLLEVIGTISYTSITTVPYTSANFPTYEINVAETSPITFPTQTAGTITIELIYNTSQIDAPLSLNNANLQVELISGQASPSSPGVIDTFPASLTFISQEYYSGSLPPFYKATFDVNIVTNAIAGNWALAAGTYQVNIELAADNSILFSFSLADELNEQAIVVTNTANPLTIDIVDPNNLLKGATYDIAWILNSSSIDLTTVTSVEMTMLHFTSGNPNSTTIPVNTALVISSSTSTQLDLLWEMTPNSVGGDWSVDDKYFQFDLYNSSNVLIATLYYQLAPNDIITIEDLASIVDVLPNVPVFNLPINQLNALSFFLISTEPNLNPIKSVPLGLMVINGSSPATPGPTDTSLAVGIQVVNDPNYTLKLLLDFNIVTNSIVGQWSSENYFTSPGLFTLHVTSYQLPLSNYTNYPIVNNISNTGMTFDISFVNPPVTLPVGGGIISAAQVLVTITDGSTQQPANGYLLNVIITPLDQASSPNPNTASNETYPINTSNISLIELESNNVVGFWQNYSIEFRLSSVSDPNTTIYYQAFNDTATISNNAITSDPNNYVFAYSIVSGLQPVNNYLATRPYSFVIRFTFVSSNFEMLYSMPPLNMVTPPQLPTQPGIDDTQDYTASIIQQQLDLEALTFFADVRFDFTTNNILGQWSNTSSPGVYNYQFNFTNDQGAIVFMYSLGQIFEANSIVINNIPLCIHQDTRVIVVIDGTSKYQNKPIKDIKEGDAVVCDLVTKATAVVIRVHRTPITTQVFDFCVIKAHALKMNYPNTDTIMTSYHKILPSRFYCLNRAKRVSQIRHPYVHRYTHANINTNLAQVTRLLGTNAYWYDLTLDQEHKYIANGLTIKSRRYL